MHNFVSTGQGKSTKGLEYPSAQYFNQVKPMSRVTVVDIGIVCATNPAILFRQTINELQRNNTELIRKNTELEHELVEARSENIALTQEDDVRGLLERSAIYQVVSSHLSEIVPFISASDIED